MNVPASSLIMARSQKDYDLLLPELEAYLTGHWLTDLANFSAFVYLHVPAVNWAGFYLWGGQCLRLGPFVGRPACTEILPGRGVCGVAFQCATPQVVSNVEEFSGHIACDSASRSELVLPLWLKRDLVGVFDLDSPELGRFRADDLAGLERWLSVLTEKIQGDLGTSRPWA